MKIADDHDPAADPLLTIDNATPEDVPIIQDMYQDAIAFQSAAGVPRWERVDIAVVENDIRNRNQHKLSVDGVVAGVFSLCAHSLLDRELWKGRHPEQARYMHRIIVKRAFRGCGLFEHMLDWSQAEARRLGASLLRMDTWADNPALMAYYQRFGFALLGAVTTSESPELPAQYRGLRLALLEKRL